jgi:hypothetical protein
VNKDDQKREYIFNTTDPLGREVKLKTTTWHYHVLEENERHELSGQEEEVEKVIQNPYFILPDKTFETRQNYIDVVNLDTSDKLKSLFVSVDYNNSDYGDIVTVIAKSSVRESTERGVIYERSTGLSNE